jgi:hypothetical protein
MARPLDKKPDQAPKIMIKVHSVITPIAMIDHQRKAVAL